MINHVTWSRDQLGYKNPAHSCIFHLFAPVHLNNYPRRNSFTLDFELLFTFFLTLPILFFLWTSENILRRFLIMSFPNFKWILSEFFQDFFKLCLRLIPIASYWHYSTTFLESVSAKNSISLLTESILLPLESKQCPLTLASVLAFVDSVDELRFWSESESYTAQRKQSSSKEM